MLPSFQSSLLEDAVKRTRRHIEVGLASNSYGAGLNGVRVLPMATGSSSQSPTVLLDQLNYFSKLHVRRPPDTYQPLVCKSSLGSSFCTSSPRMASPTSAEHSATTCGSL